MGSKVLGLMFFCAILAVVALNFKPLLTFSQEHMIYQSAEKAIDAENWPKAIDLYRTGMRQYPDNMAIAQKLGWLYERNNQIAEAEKVYRNILDVQPGYLDARIGLANVLKRDPLRMNEAVDEFRKALRLHHDDPILLSQIGSLYKTAAENPRETRQTTRKWLYDQARYYYELSLKLDPKQFQTHFNVGVAYQYLGNQESAAKAYCQAVIADPASYQARYNLGLSLSELNYLDEAYRQMDRAVALISQGDDMATARQVAQKVQNVKNSIYNNAEKRGLAKTPDPPFLDPACLYRLTPDEKAASEANTSQ